MVNKITTPPTTSELIGKINELVDNKQDTVTGAVSNVVSENLTANRPVCTNGSGKLSVATTVTNTQLGYLSGATSNIQNQLDNKQPVLVSGTNIKTINNISLLGSGNIDIQGGGSITVDSALSTTSTNPVQNKVITNTFSSYAKLTDNTQTITAKSYKTANWTASEGSTGNLLLQSGGNNSAILRKTGSFTLNGTDGKQIFDVATDGKITSNGDLVLGYKTENQAELTGAKIKGYDAVAAAVNSETSGLATKQATSNLVTSLSSSSTDAQYPSAKCVYDIVGDIETLINAL